MPRRRKDLVFEESLFNNMEDYEIFKSRFLDLACGCFNFENLPKNIYKPFIIKQLILQGSLLAFRDEVMDKIYLYPYCASGPLNEYNLPTKRHVVFFNNGASYYLNEDESVILRANVSGTSIMSVIEYFARQIYLINRTIQININAQKTPVALTCDENTRLTYENLLKQYQGNVPVIFGSKDLDINALKSISLNAPFVADKLYAMLSQYWNEFLTFFGIPNLSINKKERLITDEVTRTMGGILIARQNFENQIREDIEQINDMFGTDIMFTWGVKRDTEIEVNENLSYNEDKDEVRSEDNE